MVPRRREDSALANAPADEEMIEVTWVKEERGQVKADSLSFFLSHLSSFISSLSPSPATLI
jgi:hypothetical protein